MKSHLNPVRNFFAHIRYAIIKLFRLLGESARLNKQNWKWITAGTLAFIILFVLGNAFYFYKSLSFASLVASAILLVSMPLLFGILIKIGVLIIGKIPSKVHWLVFASVAVFFIYFNTTLKGILVLLFYFLLTFVFLFGSISNLGSSKWLGLSRGKKLLNIFFLSLGICNFVISIYFLSYGGPRIEKETDFSYEARFCPEILKLNDPSVAGPFEFEEFTYGTGADKHRAEFAEEADFISYAVNGSAFVSGWDKFAGKMRTHFWGFDADSLPLNGRMWLPKGKGPFPLVLIVHGNHFDRDFSDQGYGYIARHLASHGVLTVSVDENFLNSGLMNFNHYLQTENDARAWLLLKHLELLRDWNMNDTAFLAGKVDTQNVILIGHSRGGEAVNVASCFNKLPYYPDNYNEKFNFNFGIKGVVAIAQVDGQYQPSNVATPLSNINYLSLQGSLDADLNSYLGLRQFNRIVFNDSLFHFKAGIYIQGANHGQFNTSWGSNDIRYPNSLLLNKRSLLEKGDQENIAKTYIFSFVKATLMNEMKYLKLFSDYRVGRDGLPATKYIGQYSDSNVEMIADFEEDLNLSTSSSGLVTNSFEGMAKVYEQEFYLGKGKSGTKSLALGWNNENDSLPGTYTLNFIHQFSLDRFAKFQFDVAVLTQDPGERKKQSDELNNKIIDDKKVKNKKDKKQKVEEERELDDSAAENPLGFSILFEDDNARTITLSLADYFPLNPPIDRKLFKLKIFEDDTSPEIIPQHIELNLSTFETLDPTFRRNCIQRIAFIFDEGDKGLITLDNIGFN